VRENENIPSYVDLLREEFGLRAAKNRRYSLKAYARDLGLPATHLSEVFRRKRGISPAQAQRIADRLGFDAPRANYFSDLVSAHHSRSEAERTAARKRALRHAGKLPYRLLAEDRFKVIEDWFHVGTAASPDAPPTRVRKTLARLRQLGKLKAREQPLGQPEFNSIQVAVDPEQIPEVKRRIYEFLSDLDRELGKARKKSKVYCLGIQFFELPAETPSRR